MCVCVCIMCQQLDHLWLPDTDFLSTDLLPVANLFCKEQGFVFSSLSLQKLLHYTRHLNICNKKLISCAHKNQIWLWLKKCAPTLQVIKRLTGLLYIKEHFSWLWPKKRILYTPVAYRLCACMYINQKIHSSIDIICMHRLYSKTPSVESQTILTWK